ncbi:unnamed protein product [Cyprideis torosa]|uniref:poly(A)-specific ribonuclease n=1 Tax=Cyprideis torosa TaxID=163714 RepID=A0A7R8WAR1_9CRUS|nr:unnamed protein product [Cyprideis torosa]CAG0891324.1 unnamed protein product [Cyprideis torosa]
MLPSRPPLSYRDVVAHGRPRFKPKPSLKSSEVMGKGVDPSTPYSACPLTSPSRSPGSDGSGGDAADQSSELFGYAAAPQSPDTTGYPGFLEQSHPQLSWNFDEPTPEPGHYPQAYSFPYRPASQILDNQSGSTTTAPPLMYPTESGFPVMYPVSDRRPRKRCPLSELAGSRLRTVSPSSSSGAPTRSLSPASEKLPSLDNSPVKNNVLPPDQVVPVHLTLSELSNQRPDSARQKGSSTFSSVLWKGDPQNSVFPTCHNTRKSNWALQYFKNQGSFPSPESLCPPEDVLVTFASSGWSCRITSRETGESHHRGDPTTTSHEEAADTSDCSPKDTKKEVSPEGRLRVASNGIIQSSVFRWLQPPSHPERLETKRLPEPEKKEDLCENPKSCPTEFPFHLLAGKPAVTSSPCLLEGPGVCWDYGPREVFRPPDPGKDTWIQTKHPELLTSPCFPYLRRLLFPPKELTRPTPAKWTEIDSIPAEQISCQNASGDPIIRNVWSNDVSNALEEISTVAKQYPFIAVDTEFPGTTLAPVGVFRTAVDYNYATVRLNCNSLKIIQLGLSFFTPDGRHVPGTSTWQFNFRFDRTEDPQADRSIIMLEHSGIQFRKHGTAEAIDPAKFVHFLKTSGILWNPSITWISFHSGYDFGYLIRMILGKPLPACRVKFLKLLRETFPNVLDLKYLMKSLRHVRGGLQENAIRHGVKRIGRQHQAGSDSLVTGMLYFQIRRFWYAGHIEKRYYNQRIFGLTGDRELERRHILWDRWKGIPSELFRRKRQGDEGERKKEEEEEGEMRAKEEREEVHGEPEPAVHEIERKTTMITEETTSPCRKSADQVCDLETQEEEVPGDMKPKVCGTPGYLAPELLKSAFYEGQEGYDKRADIWACGVIMYTLLVGCPPFWHRKQMMMLRNIVEGRYSFHSPEWDSITEAPKDLIRGILVTDPDKRLTIEEILRHDFFTCGLVDTGLLTKIDEVESHLEKMARRTLSFRSMQLQARRDPRRDFRRAILVVRCSVRIRRLKYTPEPISIEMTQHDPYKIRNLRRVVDAIAFRVYGHWVKRGDTQNRAALFENQPKVEIKNMYDLAADNTSFTSSASGGIIF